MKKITLILISLLIFTSGFVVLDTDVDTNSKFKAVFIYNFTKYIEWPETYRDGSFVIGVYGESPLYKELTKMAQTKKVANQSITIVKFSTLNDLKKSHILYISKDKNSDIPLVLKKIKSNSTLTITEEEGLIERGAGINFIVKNNRLEFELNKKNIQKNKLKLNSNLEALAISIK